MSVSVEILSELTDEIVASLNELLPQLSTTTPPLGTHDVARMIENPMTTVFLARLEGRIVGTLTLVVFSIPTGLRAWIEDVVVDGSARGVGVGEVLTAAAINRATEMGARSIDLTSRPSRTAANSLYLKLGFSLRETNVYRISL